MAIHSKIYLDKRHKRVDGTYALKVGISKNGSTAYISLGVFVFPSQWDKIAQKVLDVKNKDAINLFISNEKIKIDNTIMELSNSGALVNLSASEVKDKIIGSLEPTRIKPHFIKRMREFIATKTKQRTKEIYQTTLNKIIAFDNNAERSLVFENIDIAWLHSFNTFLMENGASKRNARNVHFRNIRAIFNYALDMGDNITYPFRRFKIKPEETLKRSLSTEQVRTLINAEVMPFERKYIDTFILSFYLIGINMIDLISAPSNSTERLDYIRQKTGRSYSVKIEPEAAILIDKLKGRKSIIGASETYNDYRQFASKINKYISKVAQRNGLPKITTYWARHSWATIAAELDIPKETIAAALGHGGRTVTDIYIDFNTNKIDEANRRVIDYVLYDKDYRKGD